MTDRFAEYHDLMAEALTRYREHAATVKAIRDAKRADVAEDRATHPHAVGGRATPLEFDVYRALQDNPHYEVAKAERDAARLTALMWGVGALVEAVIDARTDSRT